MSGILTTETVLDKIVATKLREVEDLKARRGSESPPSKAPDPRDFVAALSDTGGARRSIIAEAKKASPSAGVIRDPFDHLAIARAYQENGARAISVVTDAEFFQGSLEMLEQIRREVSIPLLCKDFIIDPVQVDETREAGADAILLIARILDDELFQRLYKRVSILGMASLVEVHDERDLKRALKLDPVPRLIGVNNRNLADFSVSIDTTLRLLPMMPKGVVVVSESGLGDSVALDALTKAGAHAFLIGTAFMKAADPGAALREMAY